jgi:cation diffusion facilitator CzcD-associated flavoprotein CzcO
MPHDPSGGKPAAPVAGADDHQHDHDRTRSLAMDTTRSSNDHPRIAIIGSGISGLALAVRLLRAGIGDFDIFEEQGGLGGTWYQNRYPGAAVDVHSALYQFSFAIHRWRRTHGLQHELLEYLEDTARRFGVDGHIRFNTKVDSVHWDESHHLWRVLTADNEYTYRIVVAATGFLNDPNMPTWPGLSDFKGVKLHSSDWRSGAVDVTGKRVAVVGVGSTSVQIVPAIQPIAEQVLVFQREPGWVLPKGARDFTEEELARHKSLLRRKLMRWRMIISAEWQFVTGPVYVAGNRRNQKAEKAARDYINTVFKDRPDLREAVMPNYPFSGKRRVLSDDFYHSLLEDNVTLIPSPVTSVTEAGPVAADGNEYPVDVLVIASGFKASSYLSRLGVFGAGGKDIQKVWRDGAYALAGMTVPGFPNFYMMYGPGTNGAGQVSVNSLAENQATWIIKDIRRMERHGYTAIETRRRVTALYNQWLQKRLQRTAWAKANNYMKGPSGNIVTQFHGGITLYRFLLKILRPLGSFGWRLSGGQTVLDAPSEGGSNSTEKARLRAVLPRKR